MELIETYLGVQIYKRTEEPAYILVFETVGFGNSNALKVDSLENAKKYVEKFTKIRHMARREAA